ncbi:MAG: glutamate--tRNA ligase [Pseudomonadota bacterium]
MPNPVVTRFAPSPTGFLHIGGARTALFNWLFARHHGGRFLLRIEDTDRARSTPEATQAILDGLTWLGLDWDGEAVSQAAQAERHAAIAHTMLDTGTAYRCYATKDDIEAAKAAEEAAGRPALFRSPWRDSTETSNAPYVVRLKAPQTGQTVVQDAVQGQVTWQNDQLDDLVLLRSDGTPTYMLAVVVDDHDMGVTHVIRGDDHLTNAARQTLIYQAMGWDVPVFAHIPLIHGPDGAKLSKRHGALGVEAYAEMGFPPEAVRNYLARLGWSHGDDEFFTTDQAIAWFGLDGIGKSPARFDLKKLENLSGQHLKATAGADLATLVADYAAAHTNLALTLDQLDLFARAAPALVARGKTLPKIIETAQFFLSQRPLEMDEKSAAALDTVSRGMLNRLTSRLRDVSWTQPEIEALLKEFAEQEELKFGKVAQPLRAALSGQAMSPSVLEMMEILGKEETLGRLEDVI